MEMLRKILLACSDGGRKGVKQFVLWLYGSLWLTIVDARAVGYREALETPLSVAKF